MDSDLLRSLTLLLGVWAVTVVTPGPNFLATAHAAASGDRRAGGWVAAGVAAGTAIWAAASLAGLGLLFQTAGWLYQAVKVAGAVYLVAVGVGMLLAARQAGHASVPPMATFPLSARRAFRLGLVTDLSNPKAAAFFASLFAVAVPPAAPIWFHGLAVASVVAIAAGWYGAVAWAMGGARFAAAYRRARRVVTAVAGAVFVGFGLRLAADR